MKVAFFIFSSAISTNLRLELEIDSKMNSTAPSLLKTNWFAHDMGSDWTVAPLKKIDREARWIGIYPLHLWPTLRCRNHRQCRLP